jgi:mRNA interferase MazF
MTGKGPEPPSWPGAVSPGALDRRWASSSSQIRTLSVERIGRRHARGSEEEVDRVVEGLNEIIG